MAKKILIIGALLWIVSAAFVVAQTNPTSTVATSTLRVDLQLPDLVKPQSTADLVAKVYSWAIAIAGTLAVIMIIYGGVNYVISGGNEAAQKEAKDIITSAVWGIALLAGAYIILKTINPRLIQIADPNLEPVTLVGNSSTLEAPAEQAETAGGLGGTATGCTYNGVDQNTLSTLAAQVLERRDKGLITIRDYTSCGKKDGALQNIVDAKSKQTPFVGNPSCAANDTPQQTGTVLCPNMLEVILKVADAANSNPNLKFAVNYLLGGEHSNGSGHYSGLKADIAPLNPTDANWQAIHDEFAKYSKPAFEYNVYSKEQGKDVTKFSHTATDMRGGSNGHLDIKFGGQGTPPLDQQVTLKNDLQSLAQRYLNPIDSSIPKPGLMSDGSFGILPSRKDYACPVTSNLDSSPYGNISDVAKGLLPVSCNNSFAGQTSFRFGDTLKPVFIASCKCARGGASGNITLNKRLLEALIKLQEERKPGGRLAGINFRIVAITGGIQGTVTLKNVVQSAHGYYGQAFELVPVSGGEISQNKNDWKKLLEVANSVVPSSVATYKNAFVKYEKLYREPIMAIDYIHNIVQDQSNEWLDCTQSEFSSSDPSVLYNEGAYSDASLDDYKFDTTLSEGCYNPRIHVNIN